MMRTYFVTNYFPAAPGVCVHLGSSSALVAIVSLLTEFVMDAETALLAQTKPSVQVKV